MLGTQTHIRAHIKHVKREYNRFYLNVYLLPSERIACIRYQSIDEEKKKRSRAKKTYVCFYRIHKQQLCWVDIHRVKQLFEVNRNKNMQTRTEVKNTAIGG